MKKHITVLLSTLALPASCIAPTTMTGCSCTKAKVDLNTDDHIHSVKINKEYNSYWECNVPKTITYSCDSGYQIKSCIVTIYVHTTKTYGPVEHVMEFDNSNTITIPDSVYEFKPTDNKVHITMVSCPTFSIPIHINNACLTQEDEGKFIVNKVDDSFNSDSSYTISSIKSKTYYDETHSTNIDIHNVNGLVGTIKYLNSNDEVIGSKDIEVQTIGNDTSIEITNKEISAYLKDDLKKIVVDFESAPLNLSYLEKTAWDFLGEISAKSNNIEFANKYFNPGDSIDLYINNVLHTIRIVGIGQDTLADSQNKATFTFEFVTPFTTAYETYIGVQWEDGGTMAPGKNYNYSTSNISNYINNTSETANEKGFKTWLKEGLGNSQSYLKTINRTFLLGDSTLTYVQSSFNTQVFLPSVVNICSKNGILASTLSDTQKDMIRSESEFQYKYYEKTIGPAWIYDAYTSNRVKKYKAGISGASVPHVWLSTPYPSTVVLSSGCHAANLCAEATGFGALPWYCYTFQTFAICPCFCF